LQDSLKIVAEKKISEVKIKQQKIITYISLAGISVVLVLLFFVYRNYSKQRIANEKLKQAQQLLIESEKMAAFGVVASRVAHEIQNPLNFVNNFSELSQEALEDLMTSTTEEERRKTKPYWLPTSNGSVTTETG
jgi:C4-dicarboxylate-specific signal transduction histidine kinase